MRMRWFKRVVTPTLLFNATGIMVEALETHLFPEQGTPLGPYHQEVAAPHGAAVIAVQFVHEVGTRYRDLRVFQVRYVHRAPGRDLYEEYLAAPFDSIEMAATPVDTGALNGNQRQVLTKLLQGSDPQAWAASPEVRAAIEGR